jgi:L-ribulose-5-phosphate 3-epimerase
MNLRPKNDRREFLKWSALSTVATAAGGLAGFPGSKASGRETDRLISGDPGVPIYTAIKGGGIGGDKAAMVARLKELKSLGFDGVESVSPGIADVSALRAASDEVDFPIHGLVDEVHWNQRLSSPDEKIRDIGRNALAQALKDAKGVGASSVLLVPGRVAGDDENHDHVWKRSIVEIRKVLPIASRLGIRILIENVWNGFCETPEQMRDYVDEIDSPWVGVYFDIGNCRKFGPAEDWVRTLAYRIVKLDVKDWGVKNSFCRLGEGDVNWPETMKALAEIGFSGWATREGEDKSLSDTVTLIGQLMKGESAK